MRRSFGSGAFLIGEGASGGAFVVRMGPNRSSVPVTVETIGAAVSQRGVSWLLLLQDVTFGLAEVFLSLKHGEGGLDCWGPTPSWVLTSLGWDALA